MIKGMILMLSLGILASIVLISELTRGGTAPRATTVEAQQHQRAVGAAGEIGLMQILPSTGLLIAKGLGVDFEAPARNKSGHPLYSSLGTLGDPRLNVRFGITYFKGQVERFGMGPVALRAYNRNPDHAKQRRPWDRYAEDIGLRFVSLVHEFPR